MIRTFLIMCVCLISQLCADPSSGEQGFNTETAEKLNSVPDIGLVDYQGSFIKMIVALVLLLSAVTVTFWLFRKFMAGTLKTQNASSAIKILERRALSPKTALYLIEVDGEKTLITESQLEIKSVLKLQTKSQDAALTYLGEE